jgi:TolA-binding protein
MTKTVWAFTGALAALTLHSAQSYAGCTVNMSPQECYENGVKDVGAALGSFKLQAETITQQIEQQNQRIEQQSQKILQLEAEIGTLASQQTALRKQFDAFGSSFGQLKFEGGDTQLTPDRSSKCQDGEAIIGGYCELETGNADLFNAGIRPPNSYQCDWRTLPGGPPISTRDFAICLNVNAVSSP